MTKPTSAVEALEAYFHGLRGGCNGRRHGREKGTRAYSEPCETATREVLAALAALPPSAPPAYPERAAAEYARLQEQDR